jgi:MoaA/NifB/PqqE/SkfB family radical SAM enzyme
MISRYLNLTKNILTSNVTRLAFPYKLTYAITYWCNYKCKTCNIWQKRPTNELTLSEIEKFFKKSNQFSWIDLTGGEVFLRKDFLSIVEVILSACKNLIVLHFPTNGYFTDKIITCVETIMAYDPEKLIITISMDGDEEINDNVRGIKGGWKRQIETFKQLHSIDGVNVVLGMTLSFFNADKFERTFEAAQKECEWLTYEDFHLNIAHVSDHYYSNEDLDLSKVDREVLISEVNKYMKLRGIRLNPVSFLEREYLRRVEQYLRSGKTPMRCHSLNSSFFLDPFGNVFPCGMYNKVIGNIRDHDYDIGVIWHSDNCKKVQKEIWDYKCPQCWTPCEAYQSILGNILRF